jgi:hypothetical protein
VKRLAVLVAAAAAALAVLAGPAGATNECRGLQICVPVAGPWVVVPTGSSVPRPSVDYQLACPRGFIVGGLDAELSTPGIDVGFRAMLGSPVNPGISTSQAAVFVGSLVAGAVRGPSFRPHIGCIPAAGGGPRVPTALGALGVYPVGRPTTLRARDVRIRPGTARVVQACRSGETLVGASHAVGFYTLDPPSAALAASVIALRSTSGRSVAVDVRAGAGVAVVRAIVQVAALCAGGS